MSYFNGQRIEDDFQQQFPKPITYKSNTMTDDKKQRATPIPQGYDRLLKGVLALPLKERADLRNALQASIDKEKEALKAAADEAAKL